MKVVYARGDEVVTTAYGATTHVPLGSHWDADDPLVKARPDLFSDDPATGLATSVQADYQPRVFVGPGATDTAADTVEQATANPGEKRQARRG